MQMNLGSSVIHVNEFFAVQMNSTLRSSSMADFAARLREVIASRGIKQAWLALEAGIPPETLSRIVRGRTPNPQIDTVQKIAAALGESVGALLGESGFDITAADQDQVRQFVSWANAKLLKAAPPKLDARETPNASPIRIRLADDDHVNAGRVSPRKARVAEFDPRRVAKRGRAAANSHGGSVTDDLEAPEREIPSYYYDVEGARMVYKAEGDSMVGLGITDRDLLFVRPEADPTAAVGRVVVCEVGEATFVKRLQIAGETIELHSENERYGVMRVDPTAERFHLVGIVVGRSGNLRG